METIETVKIESSDNVVFEISLDKAKYLTKIYTSVDLYNPHKLTKFIPKIKQNTFDNQIVWCILDFLSLSNDKLDELIIEQTRRRIEDWEEQFVNTHFKQSEKYNNNVLFRCLIASNEIGFLALQKLCIKHITLQMTGKTPEQINEIFRI
jgi:hypothetical protein